MMPWNNDTYNFDKFNTVIIINSKWVRATMVKPYQPISTPSSANCPTAPSSKNSTTADFIFLNNILSQTRKPTSKPLSTSLKNYQKNTTIYSTSKGPTQNSKTPSAPPSIKYHSSTSISNIPSNARSSRGASNERSSMKRKFGQSCAPVHWAWARW